MSDRVLQFARRSPHNPTFVGAPEALIPLASAALQSDDAMALAVFPDGTASAQDLFGNGDAVVSNAWDASQSLLDALHVDTTVVAQVPSPEAQPVLPAQPDAAQHRTYVELSVPDVTGVKDTGGSVITGANEKTTRENKKKKQPAKEGKEEKHEKQAREKKRRRTKTRDEDKKKKHKRRDRIDPKELEELVSAHHRVEELMVPQSRKKKEQKRKERQIAKEFDALRLEELRLKHHAHKSDDKATVAATIKAQLAASETHSVRGYQKRTAARLAAGRAAREAFLTLYIDSKKRKERRQRKKLRAQGIDVPSPKSSSDEESESFEVVDEDGRVRRFHDTDKKARKSGISHDTADDYDALKDLIVEDEDDGNADFVPKSNSPSASSSASQSDSDDADSSSDDADDGDDAASEDADESQASSADLSGNSHNGKNNNTNGEARNGARADASSSDASDKDTIMDVMAKMIESSESSSVPSSSSSDDDAAEEARASPKVPDTPVDAMEIDPPPPPAAPEDLLAALAHESHHVMDVDGEDTPAFNFASTTYGKIATNVPSVFVPRVVPTLEQAQHLAMTESTIVSMLYKNYMDPATFAADVRGIALGLGYRTYQLAPPLASHIEKAFDTARARELGRKPPTLPSNATQRTFVTLVADAIGAFSDSTRAMLATLRATEARVDTPLRRFANLLANARHVELLNRLALPDELDGRYICPLAARPLRKGDVVNVFRIIERGDWEDAPWSHPRPWEQPSMERFVTIVLVLAELPMGTPVRIPAGAQALARVETDAVKRKAADGPSANEDVVTAALPAKKPRHESVPEASSAAPEAPLLSEPGDYNVVLRPSQRHAYAGARTLTVRALWRRLDEERRRALASQAPSQDSGELLAQFLAPVAPPDAALAEKMRRFAADLANPSDATALAITMRKNGLNNNDVVAIFALLANHLTAEESSMPEDDVLAQFMAPPPVRTLPALLGRVNMNAEFIALALYMAQQVLKVADASAEGAALIKHATALAATWDEQNPLWLAHRAAILCFFHAAFPI